MSFDVPSSRTVGSRSSQPATQVAPLSPLHVTGSYQPVSSPQSFPVSPSGGKPAEVVMDSSEKGGFVNCVLDCIYYSILVNGFIFVVI